MNTDNTENKNVNEIVCTFKSGTLKLEGTLTLPSKSNVPGILLLPGTGPADRDENAGKGKRALKLDNFKTIAHCLAANGFASFRYDKRGVGKSEGNLSNACFSDLISDAESALSYLSGREEINQEKTYVLGHSEGGTIAIDMAAKNDKIHGIILLATPARKSDELLLYQMEFILRSLGKFNKKAEKSLVCTRELFNLMKERGSWDRIEPQEIKRILTPTSIFVKFIPANKVKNMLYKQLHPHWFIESMKYDTSTMIQKVKCPVLITAGEKDYQVPKEEAITLSKEIIKSGNQNVTVESISDLNHFLRNNPGPMGPKEQEQSTTRSMDERVINIINKWLDRQ
jgi:alpha/beta superfamily hydrolase